MKTWRDSVGEVGLAGLLLAVVVMMIVPMPTAVLDALLVANIAIAALLLMAVLFTQAPLRFTVFPTLLVVTTLFRVGLNVSTTRLILSDGDAGAMVRGFGQSAAAGNVIVGLVVFAVITVVQLLVVARGAERVAEVSARFALDAMPGKQLAIDADLRSGAIDAGTARDRREQLDRESQLMGAMDGAMRFVKGDAVAAIVIVLVNLLGGLAIGVAVRGMSAGQAMQTYSVLSVGEGLLAQIPSLVSAVASGILITRVAGATGNHATLGSQLLSQLFGASRALAATALVLLGLALMPGLPIAPFAALALLFAIGWWFTQRAAPLPDTVGTGRVVVHLPAAWYAQLRSTVHGAAQLERLRAAVVATVGIAPKNIALRSATELHDDVALYVDGSKVAQAATPVTQWPTTASVLVSNEAAAWLTVDDVALLLEQCKVEQPILLRETVPALCSLPVFTELCRRLVAEGVPLASLSPVLLALSAARGIEPGLRAQGTGFDAVVEQVRSQLRRQISARWAPAGQLAVLTLDGMIEDAVRQSVEQQAGANVLALEPDIAADIINAVRTAVGAADAPKVILTSSDVRRPLRSLLETELPDVAVLAPHELSPGTMIQSTGRISV